MHSILIIDDDRDITLLLDRFLTKKGFETQVCYKGEEGVEELKKKPYDVVLCDFKLPDYTGIEILQKIKIISRLTQVIIITGYSDVRIAVEALKFGAYDYVTKPLYPDEILHKINESIEKANVSSSGDKKPKPEFADSTEEQTPKTSRPVRQAKETQNATPKKKREGEFVTGKSQQAQLVQKHIELIAPTSMSVIILGETGTGKEYVAKAIHDRSKRQGEPFIAVDCGALPKELAGSELFGHVKGAFTGAILDKKGCFELANGGTLFLDEIGNLTYENQIKLLRVLQERKIRKVGGSKDIPVDVRVLVATNENLEESIKQGEFREDIYHRLNEFKIELSPLRDRQADIIVFAQHFLELANIQLEKDVEGFDQEVIDKLKSYYWHGNLRELQNVIKRATLLTSGKLISVEALPKEIVQPDYFGLSHNSADSDSEEDAPTDLKGVAEVAERKAIVEVLRKTGFNKTKTAEVLKVDRKTLYNKLKAYNIEI